jgi:hypothetical protein
MPPTHSPARSLCALAPIALAIGCGSGGSADSPAPFDRESRGGKLHDVAIDDFDTSSFERGAVPADAPLATMFEATASDTGDALRSLSSADFEVVSSAVETTRAGARIAHVRLRQHAGGVPIWGTHLAMTAKSTDALGGARLMASSHHVYAGVKAATDPEISADVAAGLARTASRMSGAAAITSRTLVLWPLEGRLDLVWSIQLAGSHHRALVYASGDLTGRVIRVDERHYQSEGTVTGHIAIGGAPGGKGVATETPLPRIEVSADGVVATTGADGTFSIDVTEGTIITAALAGLATGVSDQTGLATTADAPAAAVTDLLIGDPADPLAVANNTAYFFTDRILDFLIANGITDEALFNLATNTNIADACNAFYTASSINFFQAGGVGGFECNNTAEATIVMHEYGHFVDDVFGGITEGGLSEGWGDLLACFITAEPAVGPDFFAGDDAPLRTCDNDYKFPPGGNDEVHNLGQAWAGFGWHAREGLIEALGESDGDALARALFLPSLPSNAADIPAAVREVFLRDDDDGDITNLTPHWDILLAAAELHGLAFVVDEDLVAPAATTDLSVASSGATTAELTWTAAGDDGDEGAASFYDVRRSSQPITETDFAQATAVPGPVPVEGGQTQKLTVALIPGETAFFALRTVDEQNNASAISNVVEVTAGEGTEVFADSFENGAGQWQATGLWHVTERKAADGASSFWYGDEATGNYNTGAANSGELVSPPIDLSGADNPVLVFQTSFDVEAGATFDRMTITAFDEADPAVSAELSELDGVSGGFVGRVLDLGGMSGRTIRVRFAFDTFDNVANETEGWFIDDVAVVADGAAAGSTLVINEILADPGSFDANNDGLVSFRDDEYVELVNGGDALLDLGGATIADGLRVRFTFPAGTTVVPGAAVVVFGGGAPDIGAPSFTAGNLALNNTGDTVTVRAADGTELASVTYGGEGGDNQSLNRAVDGDGDAAMVRHTTLAQTVASPGTRVDGTPFGNQPPPVGAILLINEILADPGAVIDANADGVIDSTDDEFVEIINIGDEPIDLSGATFSDFISVRLTLPAGTALEPGGVLVIFGGGQPDPATFAGVTTATGNGSLFLNNGGDVITLAAADGTVLAQANFDDSDDHSLNRATDLDPSAPFVDHGQLSGTLASPGRRVDGSAF